MGQYSFYGSLVKLDLEDLPHLLVDGGPGEAVLGPLVDNEADDFRGNLVRLGLASGFSDQSGYSVGVECLEGQVEGLSGVAEFSADPGYESMVMAVSPEHFIFDLTRVLGVEEIRTLEQWGFDVFRLVFHDNIRLFGAMLSY